MTESYLQRFGGIGAVPDTARNDELHFAVHAEILQRLHRRPDGAEDRQADMLDEHFLRRRRAAARRRQVPRAPSLALRQGQSSGLKAIDGPACGSEAPPCPLPLPHPSALR